MIRLVCQLGTPAVGGRSSAHFKNCLPQRNSASVRAQALPRCALIGIEHAPVSRHHRPDASPAYRPTSRAASNLMGHVYRERSTAHESGVPRIGHAQVPTDRCKRKLTRSSDYTVEPQHFPGSSSQGKCPAPGCTATRHSRRDRHTRRRSAAAARRRTHHIRSAREASRARLDR
jgi:hypothetical protein